LASVVGGNGVTTNYAYDALNRLTNVTNVCNGQTISSFNYTLNSDGKRASVSDNTGTASYQFNAADWLTQESGPYGTFAYTYDNVGNRLTKSVNGQLVQSATYDADDRNTAYTYDAAGNVLNDGVNLYAYDDENHLIASGPEGSASPTATYVYNSDGLRVQQMDGETIDNYVVDSTLGYGNVVEERDGNNNLTAHYIYGDDLLRMDRSSGLNYFLFDGRGSTCQLTGVSGTVVDAYLYDAFGNLTSGTQSAENPFLFDGQQLDGATGLYYLRARYMNPDDGRLTSQDPYDGDDDDPETLHRYNYASGDPIDLDDPSGMYTPGIGSFIEGVVRYQYEEQIKPDTTLIGTGNPYDVARGRQFYGSNGWIPYGFYKGPKNRNYYAPDIFNYDPKNEAGYTWNEIKPFSFYGVIKGSQQAFNYTWAYSKPNEYAPLGFRPLTTWEPLR
jgi:RHS repeat-associated protein